MSAESGSKNDLEGSMHDSHDLVVHMGHSIGALDVRPAFEGRREREGVRCGGTSSTADARPSSSRLDVPGGEGVVL